MEESNAKRQPKHLSRRARDLRKWISQQGRNVPGEFLQGAAYKLGSGAVTLITLWWETRRGTACGPALARARS
ncbi:hypothetical protein ABZ915_44940 [Streptomyces sp. NPDC046915]|uniref:hypothetical protein n=1 Tax=Streptomyces sp. NPDC046915 TaxID=3155257 RepID=UPI0033CDFEEC